MDRGTRVERVAYLCVRMNTRDRNQNLRNVRHATEKRDPSANRDKKPRRILRRDPLTSTGESFGGCLGERRHRIGGCLGESPRPGTGPVTPNTRLHGVVTGAPRPEPRFVGRAALVWSTEPANQTAFDADPVTRRRLTRPRPLVPPCGTTMCAPRRPRSPRTPPNISRLP
jgi:hypothetical protein